MNKQDKKLLRRFIFALYVTPYLKLNLIYHAYQFYYLFNYLGIPCKLVDFIPNEVDRDIIAPYITAVEKCTKQDFITIYVSTCKVLMERTKNE